jgi:predicted metal-binding membrane protein
MAVSTFRPIAVRPVLVVASLLAAALVAWLVTVQRMRGMDAGPGTQLGGLGWYLGIWVTMMAAMMLPAVAPVVRIYAASLARRTNRPAFALPSSWLFVAGYLAAWTLYGLLAYGVYRAVVSFLSEQLAWDRAGPYVAGGAVAAAGLYQLSPLKTVCLRHCRSPLHFFLHRWHSGPTGALRMGFTHGLYCVGCCWGLMVVLFAVGVMSLFWMALVAVLIFAEKIFPRGDRLARALAVALVAFGIWIAAAPGSVPGLTDPASNDMQMGGM